VIEPTEGTLIDLGGPRPADTPPRKRRRGVFIAASTVAVVLVGAGAYAGVRAWTGSGNTEPESVMPATATVFARIDLNPGVRDKLAFDNLIKNLPTNGESTAEVLTRIETDAAKAAGLDYGTDVKPWFDGRVGAAAWADASGNPVGLVALASKDDAKARAALARVQTAKGGAAKFGFVLKGGYALVALADADAQADATAAATEAVTHNLAGDLDFKETTARTGDHNLLVAYVDLHGLGQLASKATGALGPRLTPFGGATGQLDKLTGSFAIGGHITGDGIEIQGHAQGLTPAHTIGGADARPALDALPANSIAALATVGIDPASDTAKQLGSMIDGLLSGAGGLGLGHPDPQATGLLMALSPLLQKVLTAKTISVALIGLKPSPALEVDVQAQSEADAQAIVDPLQALIGAAGITLTRNGGTVHATFGPAGTGHLSTSPLYRKAMAGMNHAQIAAFVDVQALMAADPTATDRFPALKGIGLYAHVGDTTVDFMARLVITK
jgi:hypothetical protein